MKTQDIKKVPMSSYAFGKKSDGFHTTAEFYFKEGGVKHYIDNIGSGITHITVRNSKTGQSNILLINSELNQGRHSKTYFYSF